MNIISNLLSQVCLHFGQLWPQFWHVQMVLYVTLFTVLLTVVEVPRYFFLRKGALSRCRISLGTNMKIQEHRSTIHHHQPMVSHQRQPCPFSLYLDVVLAVVTDPWSSWNVLKVTFSLPHFGHFMVCSSLYVEYSVYFPFISFRASRRRLAYCCRAVSGAARVISPTYWWSQPKKVPERMTSTVTW